MVGMPATSAPIDTHQSGRPAAKLAVIESLGEAIALVGKAGIDKSAFAELLASTIFPAPSYATYGNLIATNQFQPARFAAPLGFKDIRLMLAAAADFGADLMSMGAYSSASRLRQLILGGTTRHILENATLPVLMNR